MSSPETSAASVPAADSGARHAHPNYHKVYYILLALLGVSIVGPMVGNLWILLITAFGVAIVKACMVGAYFMHLKFEKRYIVYLLLVCALCLFILYAGVAPDVRKSSGLNWHANAAAPAAPAPAHGGH
jgi:caa(3)-type oxidase subunit IV